MLANLTLREVRGQYKRTIFGRLWSLLNPLATMLVYTIVFAFILRIQPDAGDPSGVDVFAVWLLCGLLPWAFFASVVQTGMGSIIANAGLVQKVYFPRIVLPLSLTGSIGINWLFEMAVLGVVLLFVGSFFLPWVPLVLVMMVLLAVYATGVALVLAIANVYFRDTQYLMGIVMQIWFYLTPVIYPVSLLKEPSESVGGLLGTPITVLDVYRLNPMERYVEIMRNLLYDNRWPAVEDMGYFVAIAFLSLAIGVVVFRRFENRMAELI
nr:ABC transporter permease [Microcella alkalica]